MANDFNTEDMVAPQSGDFAPEDIHPGSSVIPAFSFTENSSALGGLQQGTTLGLSDELAGATQALMNLMPNSPVKQSQLLKEQGFTGDIGPTSVVEAYQQARDLERQKLDAQRQANPKTFFAGEMAGGLLSSGALPGEIAASPEAIGAIYGLGSSKADLTKGEADKALMDTTTGMIAGGVTGLAVPAAISAAKAVGGKVAAPAKYVGEKIKNTQAVQDILDAYRAAKSGQQISGQTDKLTSEMNKQAEDLYKALQKSAGESTKQRTAALEKAGESRVNLSDVLRQVRSEAETIPALNDVEEQAKKTLLNLLDKNFVGRSSKNLTPQEANDVIQAIKKYTPMGDKPIQDPDFAKLALKAANLAEEKLGNAVPIQELNKNISSNLAMSEALAKQNPFEQIKLGEAPDVIQSMSNRLQKLATEPKIKAQTEELMTKGIVNPQSGTKVAPLKEINPEATQIMEAAKKTSRMLDLAKKADKGSPLQITGVKGAEIAGTTAKKMSTAKDFVTEGARKLSDMGDQDIRNLANIGRQQYGESFDPYARILEKADRSNPVSRNALIFSLMQRPDFREMMRKMMNKDEENVSNEQGPDDNESP